MSCSHLLSVATLFGKHLLTLQVPFVASPRYLHYMGGGRDGEIERERTDASQRFYRKSLQLVSAMIKKFFGLWIMLVTASKSGLRS